MSDSRQNNQRRTEKSTNFNDNLRIEIKNLTVDVANDITFDIYEYFGIDVLTPLIEEWDSDAQLPFNCEVECSVFSNGRPLTCPVTLLSNQYQRSHPSFPNISILHNINREQHTFVWDSVMTIPILYSELPSDSVISFKFFARLFQTKPKLIGEAKIRLFTKKQHHLRIGPFSLTFDEKEKRETKLQKHVRRLYTYKEKAYEFIDDQLRSVSETLHPQDAEKFFDSLLHPLTPPELSNEAKFARIIILPPGNSQPWVTITHDNLMLKSDTKTSMLNPCQRLYHDLAHSQGPTKSSLLKESNITETLNKIKAYPPLFELQIYHKNQLYNNYRHCLSDPGLMPALFRSVNWDSEEETKDIVERLKTRETIDLEYALEFFTPRYAVKVVREFAVRCIKAVPKNEMILYLPQLVQACKAEYTEELPDILINYAKDDQIFASSLYWIAQVEKETNETVGKLVVKLLESLNNDVKKSIDDQIELINRLTALLTEGNTGVSDTKSKREKIRDLLQNDPIHKTLQDFPPVRIPLDPSVVIVGIDPVDVKVFQSKLRPVCIAFKKQDGGFYRVIFKVGDDMRQDQLILQLFEVMDHIFQRASMQLNITAYKTLAFSATFGCCEFIENSKAILDITSDEKERTIRNYLADANGQVDPAKIERFTESLAAYCVMTYVLKIGDRHDNNILVTKDGRLLHIDYGFILGDVTKPFTPPLKLSREMVETIDPNDGLQRICDWACPAFNSLRKRARLILVLIELMFTAPLECFQQNPMRRLQQVENCLLLNCTEIEAINSLQATFSESLNSKMQVLWDAVHSVAQSANGPSAVDGQQ